MKRKTLIVICALSAVLIAALIYVLPHLISRPMDKVLKIDFSGVDKITVANGSTGESAVIDGKKKGAFVTDMLKGVSLRKSFDQKDYTGIGTVVTLYSKNKETAKFDMDGGCIKVFNISGKGFVRYAPSGDLNEKIDEIDEKYGLS